jgi:hypothetical protein
MRYNEGRSKGGKACAVLTVFPFHILLLPYLSAGDFFTVNEVIRFVIIYLVVKTLRHLTLYSRVESNGSSRRIPRKKLPRCKHNSPVMSSFSLNQ